MFVGGVTGADEDTCAVNAEREMVEELGLMIFVGGVTGAGEDAMVNAEREVLEEFGLTIRGKEPLSGRPLLKARFVQVLSSVL